MPATMTASDLQRNIGAVYETCRATQEPVYITRNGRADLVVMDADAFERQASLQKLLYEREMRTLEALVASEDEIARNEVVNLSEARRARAAR
jgi:prevent-host-death family protein